MNQSLSGRLLVMEPDYPPIPEIFVSAVTYTPGGLHTHEDCTPFRDRGVRGDGLPGWVVQGQRPRSQKSGSFWPMVFGPFYCSSGFGTSGFGGLKTLYIFIMAMHFVSSYFV